jgi:hypothetical protein
MKPLTQSAPAQSSVSWWTTGAALTLLVQRQLKSPNAWNGRHWRYKHRESQEWEMHVFAQIAIQRGAGAALKASERRPWERRKVSVTRLVPSLRNFIRDDDNLRFSTKPLNDALKRLGLIHDDSRKWLEQTLPTQEVSTDGQYWTRITIEPADSGAVRVKP